MKKGRRQDSVLASAPTVNAVNQRLIVISKQRLSVGRKAESRRQT
jgi:hypothetical protein